MKIGSSKPAMNGRIGRSKSVFPQWSPCWHGDGRSYLTSSSSTLPPFPFLPIECHSSQSSSSSSSNWPTLPQWLKCNIKITTSNHPSLSFISLLTTMFNFHQSCCQGSHGYVWAKENRKEIYSVRNCTSDCDEFKYSWRDNWVNVRRKDECVTVVNQFRKEGVVMFCCLYFLFLEFICNICGVKYSYVAIDEIVMLMRLVILL